MFYFYFKVFGVKVWVYDNGVFIGEVSIILVANVVGDFLFEYSFLVVDLYQFNLVFLENFVFMEGDSVYIEIFYVFDVGLVQGEFYDYVLEGFSFIIIFCVDNQDICNVFQFFNDNFQSWDVCGVIIDCVQMVVVVVSFVLGGFGSFIGCEELIWEVFICIQWGCVINDDIDFFFNEFWLVFVFDILAFVKIFGYIFWWF